MPVHDWTKVDSGIFHAFHVQWIAEISAALNGGLLPSNYYALPEQRSGIFGPDVLTLERTGSGHTAPSGTGGTALQIAPPRLKPTAETSAEFYHRKQNSIVIRHVSDDRMVAVVEIVSPGNKSSGARFRAFVEKATPLLLSEIHLLIIDLFPPGSRDPDGIHAAIWDDVASKPYRSPTDKPLAGIAYEAASGVRAFVRHFAVDDPVPDLPLFLMPDACVTPPLDNIYTAAFARMPRHLQKVLANGRH